MLLPSINKAFTYNKAFYLTNGYSSLACIYHSDRFKTCLVCGDLDLPIKVVGFYVCYLLNRGTDFLQTCIDISFRLGMSCLDFGELDLISGS